VLESRKINAPPSNKRRNTAAITYGLCRKGNPNSGYFACVGNYGTNSVSVVWPVSLCFSGSLRVSHANKRHDDCHPDDAAAMTANLSALPDMSSFVGIKTRTLPLVRGSPDPLLRYAAGTVRLPAAGQVGLWPVLHWALKCNRMTHERRRLAAPLRSTCLTRAAGAALFPSP
jgi:hypothetical protein